MENIYGLFLLVFTTHLMFLINAVPQTAYTISKCMQGTRPLLIALSFGASAGIVALAGIGLLNVDIEYLESRLPIHYIPLVGAAVLLFYAWDAFKLARKSCECVSSDTDMNRKTVFSIFVMNLTSSHVMVDILLISTFYYKFYEVYGAYHTSIGIITAFLASALLWYFVIGSLSSYLGKRFRFERYHRTLHLISGCILILIAMGILLESYADIHIFGSHDHIHHEGEDSHTHTDTHDHESQDDHEDKHLDSHKH